MLLERSRVVPVSFSVVASAASQICACKCSTLG